MARRGFALTSLRPLYLPFLLLGRIMGGDSLGNAYRDDRIGKVVAVATLVLGRYADSTTVSNCWFDLQ